MPDLEFDPSNLPADGKEREAVFDNMSVEALEAALEQILDSMTEETYDGELIRTLLAVLDRKDPLPWEPDQEAAYAALQEQVRALSLDGPEPEAVTAHRSAKRRRFPKAVATIAATVAVLFVLLIGAQAAGMDVFGRLARWTNEVFHIGQSSGENYETYNMIRKALKEEDFPLDIIPMWYPEGFTAEEPMVLDRESGTMVEVDFADSDGKFFSIHFSRYNSPEDIVTANFEKDDSSVEQYRSNDKVFYILSNIDVTSAMWSDDLVMEMIQGNLTVEEVKAIIDSIGEN